MGRLVSSEMFLPTSLPASWGYLYGDIYFDPPPVGCQGRRPGPGGLESGCSADPLPLARRFFTRTHECTPERWPPPGHQEAGCVRDGVKQGGEEGAGDLRQSQAPGASTPPEAPLTPCIPSPSPEAGRTRPLLCTSHNLTESQSARDPDLGGRRGAVFEDGVLENAVPRPRVPRASEGRGEVASNQ